MINLSLEPAIAAKIRVMQQRVCWRHPQVLARGIDQTRLVLEDGRSQENFSFLVIGDSGTSRYRRSNPQRQVAKALLKQGEDARFVLHTGDVVYLLGSSEQYPDNFIKPYREFLVGGETPQRIAYDRMVFKLPFFPVLGNHDYYDFPWFLGLLSALSWPLRYLLRSYIDLDIGWHGSFKGDAYARAFLDYLQDLPGSRLSRHLATHYTSEISTGRCLTYRPSQFTRIPNRYYSFRYGGIDFFALDSNTFNQPLPLPNTPAGRRIRQTYRAQRQRLLAEQARLLTTYVRLSLGGPDEDDMVEEMAAELEQLDEQIADIDKQLTKTTLAQTDTEQLRWLREGLVTSWQDPMARGRILFFHHPPYVTEASKWAQAQTLAVRHALRDVFDQVQAQVGEQSAGRPLVDLVLNGHAHCQEHLRTEDTGRGDANINWVVCGGSGYSLRRQRTEGPELYERIDGKEKRVATSQLFLGRSGWGLQTRRPYSGLRVDIGTGSPPELTLTPIVVEKTDGKWTQYCLEAVRL